MTTQEQETTMNDLTVYEMRVLNTACGLIAITGNGQLCAMVSENEAEDAERLRCMNGY